MEVTDKKSENVALPVTNTKSDEKIPQGFQVRNCTPAMMPGNGMIYMKTGTTGWMIAFPKKVCNFKCSMKVCEPVGYAQGTFVRVDITVDVPRAFMPEEPVVGDKFPNTVHYGRGCVIHCDMAPKLFDIECLNSENYDSIIYFFMH